MPAVRLTTRRRRSSHAISKPGAYGARPVTFAPNVTPITYVETDDDDILTQSPSSPRQHHHATLFPPSSTPAPPPTRRRCPPGKRRSQGYIPRPPNAFMLFRADFVRQKHVPGSIETNHGSLSKIIGNCWRQLPLEEKRIWEIKAKQEKANHKAQFPDYRFRPVHNKNKNKDKFASIPATTTTLSATATSTNSSSSLIGSNSDNLTQEEEERRCEQVAQLLLEGMKGEELAKAVRDLDRVREEEITSNNNSRTTQQQLAMPIPMSSSFHNPFGNMGGFGYSNSGLTLPPSAYIRRPSSVPLPPHNSASDFFSFDDYATHPQALDMSAITLPSVPFMTRPSSPINNISRQNQQRTLLGQRRASSAQPVFRRSWTMPYNNPSTAAATFNNTDFSGFDWTGMTNLKSQVQRDESPLPDVAPEYFNGFSFNEGGPAHTADPTSSSLFSLSSSSTCSDSSVSDRNSPPSWLDTVPHHHSHQHSRSHSQQQQQHLAIAPHDLPPLHVSDMNWHGASNNNSCVATTQSLLSATSSSSSSSSTFPSPSLSSSPASNTGGNAKLDLGVTPTNEMFELSLGYEMGMDMNGGAVGGVGGGGVDYGYNGYNDMGFGGVGDLGLGLEMGGYVMSGGAPQQQGNNEMGMWNVGQAQQA